MNILHFIIGKARIYHKQRNCDHDWRIKGFGTMETSNFISITERCPKCKKQKTMHA